VVGTAFQASSEPDVRLNGTVATRRWTGRAKVRVIVRFGAAVGLGVALLLSAGCHAGSVRASSDADEVGSGPELESAEPQDEPTSPSSAGPVDPRVTAAIRSYDAYLRAQATALPARARAFTDAVRGGNLAAAKRNFAASRAGWQRIQSVATLLPQLDRRIDAEIDDFATPADPAWTGWHRLEYILWTSNSTAGAKPYANRLDRDLEQLNRAVPGLVITAPVMAAGIERLVEEAISEKLPGAEDRYARTDLADLAGNIEGARAGYSFARPVLRARDSALATLLDSQFAAVERTFAKYRTSNAYRAYPALSAIDRVTLRAQLTTLAETLADVPSKFR
jgi:iron uptake system component EfeO